MSPSPYDGMWPSLIILWLIFACVAAIIAHKKGQSAFGFFFAGLILGIFGVLWAWAMGDLIKNPPLPLVARNSITEIAARKDQEARS